MTKDKKPKNKSKEVVVLEATPVEQEKQTAPQRVDNIRIDKIGSLTLNMVGKPLKKRYEKHYKEDKMHLIIDVVLLAIILILLGVILNVYIFSKTKLLNLVDFQVTSNPTELINGQESEFTIDYTNTTKNPMTDLSLVLKRPKSLHNPEYSIEEFNLQTNTLKIGELAPQAHGQFKIKGFLLGDLDSKHDFLAVINYKNQFGQDRQEFFRQDFTLNGSALQAKLSLPKKVIATSPFETKLYLKNTSEINFDNLQIKMSWPQDYTFNSTELEGSEDGQSWSIGNYDVNREDNYSFTGKAYIDQPKNINLGANIYVNYDGQQFLLAKAFNNVFVDFSKFKINLTGLENTQAITPGGSATYTLFYKNEESYAVSNVELGLNLSGEYAKTRKVRVNQNDYAELARIEPGQEGLIELTGTAKTVIDYARDKEGGYVLEARGFAAYDDPIENARISVESDAATTQVNSRLSINTTGIFYTPQGDQIGVGSVPPVVGEYTSYWVFVKAINTTNPIKALKITAKIGPGVEFTDIHNVSQGNQIVYNAETRQITWTLSSVEQFAGIFASAPEARIQLAIIPSEAQLGSSPALLTNITATATDTKTGTFLSATGKNITTAIFSDDFMNKVIE